MESPSTSICLSCSSHLLVHKGHMNSEEPLYSLQDSVPAARLGNAYADLGTISWQSILVFIYGVE